MYAGDELYDDDVTSGPLPGAAGSGRPPGRTAVGAPASEPSDEPFEAMLLFIDKMDGASRRLFLRRLRERFPADIYP